MDWLHSTYLLALAAVPVAVALFLWAAWRRRQAMKHFGDLPLVAQLTASVSARRRRYKAALVVLAVALLGIALAGPRFGTKLREVKREGVDLVIALDVSLSMQAEDVLPNRLAKAKFEIGRLVGELTGDRVGLVLFAGEAFVQCPMTLDYSAIRLFLDVADPSMIPVPGTNFAAAIRTAISMLDASRKTDNPNAAQRARALLIVSDGENHVPDLEEAMDAARDAGIVVFAAGIGETDGVPIPIYQNGQRTGFKEDTEGRVVSTRLEEDVLQEMSENGGYYRITRTSSSLPEIKETFGRLERAEFDKQLFEEFDEQFQWPLGLALLLLLFERILSDRRSGRRSGRAGSAGGAFPPATRSKTASQRLNNSLKNRLP